MQDLNIEIKTTNRPSILKFEINEFLTEQKSFEFNNIEDAQNSPIASQLFHLPFVKTVFISQNFIAIEKFNIVEWEDVQDEVAEQLLNFLKYLCRKHTKPICDEVCGKQKIGSGIRRI